MKYARLWSTVGLCGLALVNGDGAGDNATASGGNAGSTCESFCQRAQDCPNADPEIEKQGGCGPYCDGLAEASAKAGCESEFDTVMSCVAKLTGCDIMPCSAEAQAWIACGSPSGAGGSGGSGGGS